VASQILSSKQLLTLVLTPSRGGVLINALVLSQQAEIQQRDNNQARVRVVAGVSEGAGVSASLGNTPLLSNFSSPAVSAYGLVNASSQNLAIAVGGKDLAASNFAPNAGGDYTLLVRGTPLAAQSDWIEDDNRAATDNTQARLRLVNSLAGAGAPLSLTVDLVPVASGVLAGAASSAYSNVAATTTARLSVTSPGLLPLFTAVDQSFVAGANYTVFVMGSAGAPTGTLRKDR
jgi:hypothetical protein